MDLHIDLGQIIISALIASVGFLIKSEISEFKKKLDKHDTIILELVRVTQRLIGRSEMQRWDGTDRRSIE